MKFPEMDTAPIEVSGCTCHQWALTNSSFSLGRQKKQIFIQKCLLLDSTLNSDDFEDLYIYFQLKNFFKIITKQSKHHTHTITTSKFSRIWWFIISTKNIKYTLYGMGSNISFVIFVNLL